MDGRRSARYFNDKWVFSDDLLFGELAASYGIKDLAKSVVSQWGVAINDLTEAGLRVTATINTFSVAPGRCVDINGNVIYVPGLYPGSGGNAQIGNPGDEGYVPAGVYPQNQNLNALGAWDGAHYITIAYALASGSLEVDDDGVAYPTRAYDTYVIVDLQTPGTLGVQIPLATITTQSGSVVAIQDTRPLLSTYAQANVASLETHQRYLHACGLVSPDGSVPYATASGSLGTTAYPTAGKDYLAFQQLSIPVGGTVADLVYVNGKQVVSLQGALTFNYDGLATSGSYAFYVQNDGTISYDYTYAGYYIPPTENVLQSSRTKYYFAGGHYNPSAGSGAMWSQVGGAAGVQDLRRYWALRANQIRNIPSGSLTAVDVQTALYQAAGAATGLYVLRTGDTMSGTLQLGTVGVPLPGTGLYLVPASGSGQRFFILRDTGDTADVARMSMAGALELFGDGTTQVALGRDRSTTDPNLLDSGAILLQSSADATAVTGIRAKKQYLYVPASPWLNFPVYTKGVGCFEGGIVTGSAAGLLINTSQQVAVYGPDAAWHARQLLCASVGYSGSVSTAWILVATLTAPATVQSALACVNFGGATPEVVGIITAAVGVYDNVFINVWLRASGVASVSLGIDVIAVCNI